MFFKVGLKNNKKKNNKSYNNETKKKWLSDKTFINGTYKETLQFLNLQE